MFAIFYVTELVAGPFFWGGGETLSTFLYIVSRVVLDQ